MIFAANQLFFKIKPWHNIVNSSRCYSQIRAFHSNTTIDPPPIVPIEDVGSDVEIMQNSANETTDESGIVSIEVKQRYLAKLEEKMDKL